MTTPHETSFWHPFADMGTVRSAELVIERAADVWVWDTDGRRYFDATASLWYANAGHGRTEIADAVSEQMRRLEAYSLPLNRPSPSSVPPWLASRAGLKDLAPRTGAGQRGRPKRHTTGRGALKRGAQSRARGAGVQSTAVRPDHLTSHCSEASYGCRAGHGTCRLTSV